MKRCKKTSNRRDVIQIRDEMQVEKFIQITIGKVNSRGWGVVESVLQTYTHKNIHHISISQLNK